MSFFLSVSISPFNSTRGLQIKNFAPVPVFFHIKTNFPPLYLSHRRLRLFE